MLDNCELKKAYVLNPLAPEFVPRARREKEAYLQVFFFIFSLLCKLFWYDIKTFWDVKGCFFSVFQLKKEIIDFYPNNIVIFSQNKVQK